MKTRRKRLFLFPTAKHHLVLEANPRALHLSKRVKPGDNFYMYVNASWLHDVSVPGYETDFGVSEEIEGKIDSQLQTIVEASLLHNGSSTTADSEIDLIRIVSSAVLNKKAKENGLNTLKCILSKVSCMRDEKDIIECIADFCMANIPTLLDLRISINKNHSEVFHLCLEPDFTGINYKYYNTHNKSNTSVLKGYATLCKRIGDELNIPNLESQIQFEMSILDTYIRANNEELKKIKGSELEEKFKKIPWGPFFEKLGIQGWRSKLFFVRSYRWFEFLQDLLETLSMENWVLLFKKQCIFHYLEYLPHPFDTYEYNFFGKQLQGQEEKLPLYELTLQTLMKYCENELSYLYDKKYVSETMKKESRKLAGHIAAAAQRRLLALEWLEPASRKKAAEKMEHMKLGIASPTQWKQFESIQGVDSENIIQTLAAVEKRNFKNMIKEIGKPSRYWDEGNYRVNAYYFSETNELIIPAGSIQSPFYSDSAPLGWNYGGIGAIMGHEITHGFDKDGKDYDPSGKLKTWWTSKDLHHYNEKSKALIDYFSAQKIDSYSVNGDYTLNENIADLGGLAIALDALNHELKGGKYSEAERVDAYRAFFTSYAVSWRTKIRPAKLKQMLLLDRHAPPIFRVNCIVNQFDEWYTAFNIKEGDSLYLPPEKRIRIF